MFEEEMKQAYLDLAEENLEISKDELKKSAEFVQYSSKPLLVHDIT